MASRSALRFLLPAMVLLVVACRQEPENASYAPPAAAPAAEPQAPPQPGADAKPLRQVVRKASLVLEVKSVSAVHARAVALAEERGGYVQTSNRRDARGDATDQASALVLRIPAQELNAVLGELRKLADGSVSEQIGSEDVTDEVLDVDARLRNHRRLEEQLLELLKTANSVEAALKVHQELANVRGEIERLEGRRQFLEREISWATITVTLTELPMARVSEGFLDKSFGRAKHDALAVGEGIIVGAIRLAGVCLPIFGLIVLPLAGLAWALRWHFQRRARRQASVA